MSGEKAALQASRISEVLRLFNLSEQSLISITTKQADVLSDLIYDMDQDDSFRTVGLLIAFFYRDTRCFLRMKFPEMFLGYICENAEVISQGEDKISDEMRKLINNFLTDCGQISDFSPYFGSIKKAIESLSK